MQEPTHNNPVEAAIKKALAAKGTAPDGVQPIAQVKEYVARLRKNLPAEMLQHKRFVRYFLEPKQDGQGLAKIPRGSHSDPKTWSTFDECAKALTPKDAGIGYVLTGGKVHALDLDHVRNPKTGEIVYTAKEQLQRLNSWTELSVSGKGLHVFFMGEMRGHALYFGCVQYWNPDKAPRFFALTGDMLEPYTTLKDVGKDFNYIFATAGATNAKMREELKEIDPEQWAKLPLKRTFKSLPSRPESTKKSRSRRHAK